MSELDPKAVYTTMQEDSKRGPLARPLLVARVIAIAMAVGGAVPTAMTLYQSWKHGIPYNEVSHRLAQYDIWVKNFDCKINYRALTTAQGTRVDAGACNATGDVAIKVTTPDGKAAYEWIAFSQLQKTGNAASGLWQMLVGSAQAAGNGVAHGGTASAPRHAAGPMTRLAQAAPNATGQVAGMKVICQAMPTKGNVIRVIQEGNKCYRENVSLFKGTVAKREEVACDTKCQ